MMRVAALVFLLASAGVLACAGPNPPPADAGLGMNWGTGGAGGSYGTGGNQGGGGQFGTGGFHGTGGMFGGTTPIQWPEAGADAFGGPRTPDAGLAECPQGAMSEGACMVMGLTCMISPADAGRPQICTCRRRGNASVWRCYQP